MGLRERIERDLAFIMEDSVRGWAWPITLTDPQGRTFPEFDPSEGALNPLLCGLSNDIALAIDPETGALVSGRTASIALRISTLQGLGMETLPKAMNKASDTPWVVRFDDINGKPHVFKVVESRPDRTVGVIVCMLEGYTP